MLPFITSQLSGAISASFTLKLLFPASQFLGATIPAGSDAQSFILEFILTFFLMLVIINVAKGSKEQGMFAGLAIGSVVGLGGHVCRAHLRRVDEPGKIACPGPYFRAYGTFMDLPVSNGNGRGTVGTCLEVYYPVNIPHQLKLGHRSVVPNISKYGRCR